MSNNNNNNKIENFECDSVVSIDNLSNCHNKGEYIEYECIHLPSIEYNQHDGKYGYWLGPMDLQPPSFKYNSKNPNDIKHKLAKHYFCYPSHEDENHLVIHLLRNIMRGLRC